MTALAAADSKALVADKSSSVRIFAITVSERTR
jgi:hypothetical protein